MANDRTETYLQALRSIIAPDVQLVLTVFPQQKSDRYAAANFAEGHYLQVEVAGVLKASPHAELARKFLAFMTGAGFQDQIPTKNWMFPAGPTSAALPEAFGTLVQPSHTFLYAPEEVAANRKAWVEEWLAAMSR